MTAPTVEITGGPFDIIIFFLYKFTHSIGNRYIESMTP